MSIEIRNTTSFLMDQKRDRRQRTDELRQRVL